MRHRARAIVTTGFLAAVLLAVTAASTSAQTVHSLHVGGSMFAPRDYEARAADDVLVENLNTLAFDIKKFRWGSLNAEWTATVDERIELGFGGGFYQRSVPSVYRDYVNRNGAEIEQDLTLRVAPVSAVVRFLPFGRAGTVQPYVGGGVSALNWRYSETGEFIDFVDGFVVFRDRYMASGTSIGGTLLGGVRLPLNGDIYALNTELRYQFGTGDLKDSGFLTQKIDLSGLHVTVGFQVRF